MISISAKQHSKILGFSLIAYGLQFFFKALEVPKLLFGSRPIYTDYDTPIYYYLILPLDSFFLPFWLFIVSILSGILILRSRWRSKYFSLAFVFLALTEFPLGTILSFYALCYLFVISDNEIIEQELPNKTP